MRAVLAVRRTVLHQEQSAGFQATDEKPRRWMRDARLARRGPRASVISGNARADSVAGAGEHPQAAIPPFDERVLGGQVFVGEVRLAEASERPAAVGSGKDVRPA